MGVGLTDLQFLTLQLVVQHASPTNPAATRHLYLYVEKAGKDPRGLLRTLRALTRRGFLKDEYVGCEMRWHASTLGLERVKERGRVSTSRGNG